MHNSVQNGIVKYALIYEPRKDKQEWNDEVGQSE